MGTYNIPRNTKGEGRLFYIFSTKALLWTVGGLMLGVVIKTILKYIGSLFKAAGAFNIVGIILTIILALLGFVIGTFKMPKNERFEITKKAAGIGLDKVLIESIKFKLNRVKLYVYDTDELSREEIEHELDEKEKNEEKEEKLRAEQIEKANRNRRGYIR
ncbi:MAG: hypothetical protein IJH12_01775 [Clostridia bacterium]|nr:hypothetical protein [Clostridia bacterium]